MITSADVLTAGTAMSAVTLRVADLDAMTDFYHRGVGLTVQSQDRGRAVLGRGDRQALVLEHTPQLRHAPPGHAGLFHTAFLFAHRSELAAALYAVATRFPSTFTGSADHLVSEAFYFDDPEGNGVELYWDRPRAEWRWDGDHVRMDSLWLDPNAFLREHLEDDASGTPAGPDLGVGHVHLKVGDVATAQEFYVDVIGFQKTAAFGNQAVFVSAGRYHHHVAMNTWRSLGAGPRTPALGLGQVAIQVPTTDEVIAVTERLRGRKIPYRDDGATVTLHDPWDNVVRVTAAG